MSRSKIYKELSVQELENILKDTFDKNTVLKSYRKAVGGCFNTTYFVESEKPDRKLILRVAPIRPELLLNYEVDMMKSEPIIYQMIRETGVPMAETIKFDDSHKIIERDYILIEYLDAINYASPEFPSEFAPQIQYEMGLYTQKIHSVKNDSFGWVDANGGAKGNYVSWYNWIMDFINEFTEKFSNYNLLEDKVVKRFAEFFIQNKEVFDLNKSGYDSRPSLTHNDLWSPNILVSNKSGEWHIAAIIDADRAMYADREYEFSIWGNDSDMMKGYGIPLDMSEEGKLKRRGYGIILNAHNMYVSKVEYDDETEYQNQRNSLIEQVKY